MSDVERSLPIAAQPGCAPVRRGDHHRPVGDHPLGVTGGRSNRVHLPHRERQRLIEAGRDRILGESDASGGSEQRTLPLGPSAEIGRKLLALLKLDANTQIDDLLAQVEDCSPSEVIAALFELEMLGLIRQLPGRNFVKVW